ncbi:MAG: 4Fe4S-binding leucine-rich repeat protein [Rhodomicrobium sp.]
MTSDIDEAIDWQGKEIDCGACAHRELLATGGCILKHACVHDRYARRIDRFFTWNPALANDYLDHEHFEVRAIAAKFADVFLLPPLLADPDETVRWNAARRLPHRYLAFLRNDPHREVRIRVAWLIDEADLSPMMSDADYYVRLLTARRIAPNMLPAMIADEEAEVRRVVASRIEGDALYRMAADTDAEVRLAVVRRLGNGELAGFRHDPDWRVRYEVASRVPPGVLHEMRDDPDDMVREFAVMRLEQEDDAELGSNVVRLERNRYGQPPGRR